MIRAAIMAMTVLLIAAPAIAKENPVVSTAFQSTVEVHATVTKHQDPSMLDLGSAESAPDIVKYDQPVCSGFIAYTKVTYIVIVTAKHCAASEDETFFGVPLGTTTVTPDFVLFSNGDKARVETIWRSPTDDLAVLTLHAKHTHPSVFIHEGVQRTEDLFVIGMPNGVSWSYSRAFAMTSTLPLGAGASEKWGDTYQIGCTGCGPGDSGGPVFNLKGRVVGDLVAGLDDQYFMVPAHAVKTALDQFNARK